MSRHRSWWVLPLVLGVAILLYPQEVDEPLGGRCTPPVTLVATVRAVDEPSFLDVWCERTGAPRLYVGALLVAAGAIGLVAWRLSAIELAVALCVIAFAAALLIVGSIRLLQARQAPSCGTPLLPGDWVGACGATKGSAELALLGAGGVLVLAMRIAQLALIRDDRRERKLERS